MLQKISLLALRLTLGWMFFYAGITKILNPEWSAEGFLRGASNFPGLYEWLASPGVLPIVNLLNEWGLTLLGASLILGVCMRTSAILGSILMFMYYIPNLDFPYPNEHSYIVDEHIIYIAALLVLGTLGRDAGWSIKRLLGK